MNFQQASDTFLSVLFYSLAVATPLIVLIIIMYQYEKYSKWRSKEQKEADRIIVKMNEDIIETSKTIDKLNNVKEKLEKDVASFEERKKELKVELAIEDEVIVEQTKTFEDMNIKELHEVARERKVKGFSRMKKDELLKVLGV